MRTIPAIIQSRVLTHDRQMGSQGWRERRWGIKRRRLPLMIAILLSLIALVHLAPVAYAAEFMVSNTTDA